MKNHKHYILSISAHSGTSISPERRAESECKSFDNEYKAVLEKCNEATALKYEKLWINHMNSKSRCFSVMITGAGNFPVRRHQKANASERKQADILIEFYNKVMKDKVESNIIKSNDKNVIEKLQEKLDGLLATQTEYKMINKVMRSKKLTELEKVQTLINNGVLQSFITDMLKYTNGIVASFQLTSINSKIKATKQRIDSINKSKSVVTIDTEFKGFKMIQNSDTMRLQLSFDNKPSEKIRQTLKSNGYRWYSKEGIWQRQLTENAIYNFNIIKNTLEV